VFSLLMAAVFYPIAGHWIWGGGWLQKMGMWDFAGSTVVHSAGGWAALAGVLLLGPREGKYRSDGGIKPIFGHNMSTTALGVFVLWFGWFGFNPGSTMAANASDISRIAVTTNMAAAAGTISATVLSWLTAGKPDLSMILNGALAGLVAITAPCAFVSVGASVVIGLIAGALVVAAVPLFDRARLDDPVGALSVHLVNGVFGTLAVGLFANDAVMPGTTGNGLFYGGGFRLLGIQALGVAAVGAFVFTVALSAWALIRAVMGMRVGRDEEIGGLDVGEHGMEAYPDFETFVTR